MKDLDSEKILQAVREVKAKFGMPLGRSTPPMILTEPSELVDGSIEGYLGFILARAAVYKPGEGTPLPGTEAYNESWDGLSQGAMVRRVLRELEFRNMPSPPCEIDSESEEMEVLRGVIREEIGHVMDERVSELLRLNGSPSPSGGSGSPGVPAPPVGWE